MRFTSVGLGYVINFFTASAFGDEIPVLSAGCRAKSFWVNFNGRAYHTSGIKPKQHTNIVLQLSERLSNGV